jgi:catechol 2,3-dioxygenase-like lactoylglutathione lyase family enzyme
MITSIHTLIYSDDADATRAFLRDVLQWPWVQDEESEPDWPIFSSGLSEIGVHPTESDYQGEHYSHPRHHEVALMCDDISATVAELRERGAEFSGDVEDMGFGQAIRVRVPGADDILLYQPAHPTAYALTATATADRS